MTTTNGTPAGTDASDPLERSRGRGRPRDPATGDRIVAIAARLMLERGLDGFTVNDVAAAAGVAKATVYRRFPAKQDLALATLTHLFDAEVPAPDTGTLRGDLEQVYRDAVTFAGTPGGRAFTRLALLEACRDQRVAALYRRALEEQAERAAVVYQRAIDRGELPAGTDSSAAVDGLVGQIVLRALTGREPLAVAEVPRLVEHTLYGLTGAAG